MSRVDELIAKRCPLGVDTRLLGDVAQLVRGNGMPKTVLTDGGIGAIHYGQIYTRYGVSTDSTFSFVAPETASKLTHADPGDVIITNTSENLEDVGKAVAWLGEYPIVTGGHATVIKSAMDPKFLSYWFRTPSFFAQKKALATGTKVIDVSARQLAKVRIPVPPLEVQREIVQILDRFTQLQTELEVELAAELEVRRRQYEYYRNSLLTHHAGAAERIPMGDLGRFIRGRRFTKADVVAEGIPSIHYGEIYTHYGVATASTISHVRQDLANQLRFATPGDVVIAAVGETVEDVGKAVAWLGDEPVAIHDDTFLFRSEANPKFVSYLLQTPDFHIQKNQYVARAKVKRLSGESLAKILISVPSLSEQERTVALLDKFEATVNDLSTRISTELAARRQEYGYYRDRLLTFEEIAI